MRRCHFGMSAGRFSPVDQSSSVTGAERTRTLARLAVHLGANVAPGQDVVVLVYDI
jgi:hypothetical protein